MSEAYHTFDVAFQQPDPLPLVIFDPTRQKVPIKVWLRELERGAQEQILGLSQLEVVRGHVAIMPDAHLGIGCSVGTVFATVGAVVPSTVGVDLGCGMMAVRFGEGDTERVTGDRALLKKLHKQLRELIPSGFGEHAKPQSWEGFDDFPLVDRHTVVQGKRRDFEEVMESKGRKQLGSLGGGNHFIELCVDEAEQLWLILHSGSRGLGNLIGTHFMWAAKQWCDLNSPRRPKDLDWLPLDHADGQAYVEAVEWAQAYARQNRHHMMKAILDFFKGDKAYKSAFLAGGREALFTVENHHNFVQEETHFGEKVWVHRKGAVSAQVGEWGILPGSMAHGSYIVRGKGNEESLCSCAHGSGRKMSRNAAKQTIPLEDVQKSMRGIVGEPVHLVHDEAPQAYKDLGLVMSQQEALLEQVHRLRPILNVKGY